MLARAVTHAFVSVIAVVLAGSCGGEDGGGSAEGEPCGGWGAGSCAAGLYCEFEGVCAEADGVGTCKAPPRRCEPDAPSVWGCDGEQYDDVCEALAAGLESVVVRDESVLGAEAVEPRGAIDPPDPA